MQNEQNEMDRFSSRSFDGSLSAFGLRIKRPCVLRARILRCVRFLGSCTRGFFFRSGLGGGGAPPADGAPKTSKENPTFVSGELPKISGPVLVTSAGQGGDTEAMDRVLQKAGIEHTLNATASASEVASAKTIFVVVGASMKGLGAAGVSVEQELARAKAALAGASEDAVIICAHIGGEARRGDTSDPFIEMVMPLSDALIAVEGGNADGKLTQLADQEGIPYGLAFSIAGSIDIAKDMAQ